MKRIIVDDELRSMLHDFTEPLDFTDSTGRILGRLVLANELISKPTAQVVVDDALGNKLQNLTVPLELCDSSELILARVIPTIDLSEYEPWEPEFSEEESRQQEESDEVTYTTTEVLSHLRKLELEVR